MLEKLTCAAVLAMTMKTHIYLETACAAAWQTCCTASTLLLRWYLGSFGSLALCKPPQIAVCFICIVTSTLCAAQVPIRLDEAEVRMLA